MGVCCAERHTENSHAAPALLSLPPAKHRVGREQILGLCERGEHSVPGLDSKSPDSSKPPAAGDGAGQKVPEDAETEPREGEAGPLLLCPHCFWFSFSFFEESTAWV